MIGIKARTHKDRENIIKKLIPVIKKELSDNFIAFGAEGSFARGEDIEYSDLELLIFVKKIPKEPIERQVIDGTYVVKVCETKESYIQKYLEVTDIWFATGGNKILPIINEKFIEEINNYKVKDLEKKCLKLLEKRWFRFQEITAKTLNTIILKNREGFPIIFNEMVKDLLIILSYLNQTPYQTLGKYIETAKKFKIKPKGFNELIEINTKGKYDNLRRIENLIKQIFTELEFLIYQKSIKLHKKKPKIIFE